MSVGILFGTLEQLMIQGKGFKTGGKLQDKLIDISAAATAKSISIFLTNPFYLLKTRAESGQLVDTQHLWSHIKQIQQINGIRGFYYGFWATVIRDVPYQSIQFAIYKILGESMNAFETNSTKSGNSATKRKLLSYIR